MREDLFYRIDVTRREWPPLRHSLGGLPLLSRHSASRDWTIDAATLRAIQRFNWPDNVRLLLNANERAKILADDRLVLLLNLSCEWAPSMSTADKYWQMDDYNLDSEKRRQIKVVMSREYRNRVRVARALGVSRGGLYRLLDEYKIAAR